MAPILHNPLRKVNPVVACCFWLQQSQQCQSMRMITMLTRIQRPSRQNRQKTRPGSPAKEALACQTVMTRVLSRVAKMSLARVSPPWLQMEAFQSVLRVVRVIISGIRIPKKLRNSVGERCLVTLVVDGSLLCARMLESRSCSLRAQMQQQHHSRKRQCHDPNGCLVCGKRSPNSFKRTAAGKLL